MSKSQPLGRIEFAEREFEGYKEYVEDWKRKHHELAVHCWAIEDVISKANYVYDCIVRLAADLLTISTSELAPELSVRHYHLIREWLDLSMSLEQSALKLEAEYAGVNGADALRHNIAQARDDIHSPKPVMIDSAGNVYEMTGERAIMPGLDPERVLRSVNDANAGRTHSLKDIIAARTGTGI